jgi:cytidylate kinase
VYRVQQVHIRENGGQHTFVQHTNYPTREAAEAEIASLREIYGIDNDIITVIEVTL